MSLGVALQQAIQIQVDLSLYSLPWIDKERERSRIEAENQRLVSSIHNQQKLSKVNGKDKTKTVDVEQLIKKEPSKLDTYVEAATSLLQEGNKKDYVKLLDAAREDPLMTERGVRRLEEVGEKFALQKAVASTKA